VIKPSWLNISLHGSIIYVPYDLSSVKKIIVKDDVVFRKEKKQRRYQRAQGRKKQKTSCIIAEVSGGRYRFEQ